MSKKLSDIIQELKAKRFTGRTVIIIDWNQGGEIGVQEFQKSK